MQTSLLLKKLKPLKPQEPIKCKLLLSTYSQLCGKVWRIWHVISCCGKSWWNYQFSQHSSCTLFSISCENWGQDTWRLKAWHLTISLKVSDQRKISQFHLLTSDNSHSSENLAVGISNERQGFLLSLLSAMNSAVLEIRISQMFPEVQRNYPMAKTFQIRKELRANFCCTQWFPGSSARVEVARNGSQDPLRAYRFALSTSKREIVSHATAPRILCARRGSLHPLQNAR